MPLCPRCGHEVPVSLGTKPRIWCSDACRVANYHELRGGRREAQAWCAVGFRACDWCGALYQTRVQGRPGKTPLTCSDECNHRRRIELMRVSPSGRERRRDRKHRLRAVLHGADAERVVRAEVCEREGWVCWLCLEAIDAELVYPDRWCATSDHVVPIAEGGRHVLANVRPAHLRCNQRKRSDAGVEGMFAGDRWAPTRRERQAGLTRAA